jgi:hypothetical protein
VRYLACSDVINRLIKRIDQHRSPCLAANCARIMIVRLRGWLDPGDERRDDS